VSRKFVLIDNLQYDHWEIQDVARFFMLKTDEEDAFNTIREYQGVYDGEPYKSRYGGVNLDYVVIDWTMIGKSGAMHFIATGNLTTQEDGDYGSYALCGFAPQYSDVGGALVAEEDGSFARERRLVFVCGANKDGIAGFIVGLREDSVRVMVVDVYNQQIPWGDWMGVHDASIMGVKRFGEIVGAVVQYYDDLNRIPPVFKTMIYASGDFEDYMLARLYFGDSVGSFEEVGLADVEWGELRYFKPDMSFEDGYVRTWKIVYPEE
jgi:hypothetical protein